MATNDDIYQYFRCIEATFPRNFRPFWDKRNHEWSKNYDELGHCTNEARPSKVTCRRCHSYYS